jgi:hypothetical protein
MKIRFGVLLLVAVAGLAACAASPPGGDAKPSPKPEAASAKQAVARMEPCKPDFARAMPQAKGRLVEVTNRRDYARPAPPRPSAPATCEAAPVMKDMAHNGRAAPGK